MRLMTDSDLLAGIGSLLQRLQASGSTPEMYLVVIDKNNAEDYAKIKRVFDQHIGRPTVCLTEEKLVRGSGRNATPKQEKDLAQLFSNLALKFNLKLRGQNTCLWIDGVVA